jgi:hypothetical protein
MPILGFQLLTDDTAVQQIVADFSDVELELFRQFVAEYQRLVASKPLQEGVPCGLSMNWKPETGLVLTPTVPSDDDFAILLHRMRPFLLQEERASFVRVASILGKRFEHPLLRDLLAKQRRLWDGRAMQSQAPVVLNYETINTERVLLDWINAHEFHRDPSKAEAISALRKQVPPELLQWVIATLALDKVRAVLSLALLVGVVTGDLQRLNFEPHALVRGG